MTDPAAFIAWLALPSMFFAAWLHTGFCLAVDAGGPFLAI